jgi:hypothetical protein
MYNFLELTNAVNKRMNEVLLTAANFDSATGIHSDIKNYINLAINRIGREEIEWPFYHQKFTETLVANSDGNVAFPASVTNIALDTFILPANDTLNVETKKLKPLDYEEYLEKHSYQNLEPAKYASVPEFVVRTRNLSYIVTPPPDSAYNIIFEAYVNPSDLVAWDDVPVLPESFKWVIVEGAMYYAYTFKGAIEEAGASNTLFQEGIKQLRKTYINRTEYVRSAVIGR